MTTRADAIEAALRGLLDATGTNAGTREARERALAALALPADEPASVSATLREWAIMLFAIAETHPDESTEDLLVRAGPPPTADLDAVRAEERERCARVCDATQPDTDGRYDMGDVADRIRALSPAPTPDGSRDVVARIVAELRKAARQHLSLGNTQASVCLTSEADRIEAAHGKVTR